MTDTVLTHEDFFCGKLRTDFPGLGGIDALYRRDPAAAEKQFAAFLRGYLDPGVYFGPGWDRRYTEADWAALPPRSSFLSEPRDYVLNRLPDCDNISLPGENTLDIARRAMKGQVVSCCIYHDFGGEIQWEHNPTPNGYGEWTWQFNRHYEWEIFGYCYAHTGDEAYARAFRDQIMSFIRQTKAPGDVTGGATKAWRTIEIGIRLAHSWPNAIFSFIRSPEISDHQWTLIFKSVYENAARLADHPSGGNWLAMEMNGLAHAAVLFPFFRQAAEWEQRAVRLSIERIGAQIYPEGFQYELTTNYHQVVIDNVLSLVRLFRQAGRQAPRELEEMLRRMYSLYPKLATPALTLPDLNDGCRYRMEDVMPDAAALFPDQGDFRYLATGRREGTAPALCVGMPFCGMGVFRSGWGEKDLWAFFDGGPLGYGHQHEDKLNLLMWAYGFEMLTEAGTNAYDNSPRHQYVLSTRSHNGVLVDGRGQYRRPHFRPRPVDEPAPGFTFREEEGFAAASGIYDKLWEGDYAGVTHTRRVIFMKGETPYLIVIDRLKGDGERHGYRVLWHITDRPVTLSGTAARADFPGGVTLTLFTAGYEGAAVVRGRREPEFQGFMGGIDPALDRPIPTVEFSRTTDRDFRGVTVILPAKEGCPFTGVETGEDPADTRILLLTAGGRLELDETDYFKED